jgi:hypothetical protein
MGESSVVKAELRNREDREPYANGPLFICHMSYRTGSIWHMANDQWPIGIWFPVLVLPCHT